MGLNEEMLRQNFAKNLVDLRRKSGMTQLDLAEKLNYSDKSISKWERGEGLPDLAVAVTIAELFGVTLNDMIGTQKIRKPALFRNKILITILSVGLAWLVAGILFVMFRLLLPEFSSWLFFIYAIPVSAIISIVFSCIWWNKICRFLSVSALIWSLCVCAVVSLHISGISQIFIIAGVLQVLVILWFLIKKQK